MNRTEATEKADRFYRNRQLEIEKELAERRRRAESEVQGVKEILAERAALPVRSMRLAMARPDEAASIAEEMRSRGLALNQKLRELLAGAGLGENYLQPRYECPRCHDTGYVGEDAPQKRCDCFEKRVQKYLSEDASNPMARFRFEDFDAGIIPDEPVAGNITQRAITLDRLASCREYAECYPQTARPGLLLNGQAGLGKSFLLSGIYRRLLDRGVNALLISAFEMSERIRQKQFHEDERDGAFEELLTAPVLLVDDFGNEPFLRGISAEYICLILDERMNRRLHTVLTTNMTPAQIKEKYNERVSSRLTDKSYWEQLRFLGRDLRNL